MTDFRASMRKDAWRSYRIGKCLLWAGFLLYLPGMALLAFSLKPLNLSGNPAAIAAFAWMVLWLANGIWLTRFSCPMCSKRFFVSGPLGLGNLWARRCRHCGASPQQEATAE